MEIKLRNIANALAQSAIDAYNGRATFVYLSGIVENTVRLVYNELLIGVNNKNDEWKISRDVTRVALIAYWKTTGVNYMTSLQNLENETLFSRGVLATHATLKKMMKETNYQRRLQKN